MIRALGRLTLVLWLLLSAASAAFSQPSPTPPYDSSSLLERTEWELVRPTPMATLHIRRFVGYVMLVPAGTLFLLYLFRPRPYVLAGAFAWAAGSLMMLSLSFNTADAADLPDTIAAGRLGVGAWSVCALIFGAALRLASGWFRAPSIVSSGIRWTLTLALGWTIAGAALAPRPLLIMTPAFVLMTMWHLASAWGYVRIARRHRFVGAVMAGVGVAGFSLVNVSAAAAAMTSGGVGDASTNIAYFNFLAAAILMIGMHLLIFEDLIEELRAAAAEIAKSRDDMHAAAITDPLTGCYNRRFLYEIAARHLEQRRRYDLPLSLLYIDIDHFKAINDTRGHQTGDEVLITLGAILRELTRQADYVFRWGGDEFVVLLSADIEDAKSKAGTIRQAFLESAIVSRLPDGVDLSIGCVFVPLETTDLDPLIDQADKEMYRRKRALGA